MFRSRIRTEPVPSWSCSQAVSKPVWHITLLCVQWKTPDDGQRNCPKHVEFYSKSKFEKLGKISYIMHVCLTMLFGGATTLRGRIGIVNWEGCGRKRSWPRLKLGTCLEKLKRATKYVSPFVRLRGEICNWYIANMEQEGYPLDGVFQIWGGGGPFYRQIKFKFF